MAKLEQSHKSKGDDSVKQLLDQAKIRLKGLETRQVVQRILNARQKLFQYENKPGKCQANLLTPEDEIIKMPNKATEELKELNIESEKFKKIENFYKPYIRLQNPLNGKLGNVQMS